MAGHIRNGMSARHITEALWHKSSYSGAVGNCVELAPVAGGGDVAVRNSRNPDGPALIYTWHQMAAFVTSVKGGEFDGDLN
ncbi:MAG TPA: DUF397 domain-containing protein [Pseudonocardiaceae bacterium]|nr:DUF397 domain-containing protein [Pseudonocardiaceae bacterium]